MGGRCLESVQVNKYREQAGESTSLSVEKEKKMTEKEGRHSDFANFRVSKTKLMKK